MRMVLYTIEMKNGEVMTTADYKIAKENKLLKTECVQVKPIETEEEKNARLERIRKRAEKRAEKSNKGG